MQHEVDLNDVRLGRPRLLPAGEVRLAAGVRKLVRGADDFEQRDEPAVGALPDLDQRLGVLLAEDRREQRLLADVVPLRDARAVAVHQAWQEQLVQGMDEVMLKDRPQLVVFQIRIHSRERARHGWGSKR